MNLSVVTPTFYRYKEVPELLQNLSEQSVLPQEVILVDGAPSSESRTEICVKELSKNFPFRVRYFRHSGGTAIQRNYGIDQAQGDIIALIDDDVRLNSDFFEKILTYFEKDKSSRIGGITGYKKSHSFNMEKRARWRWYKRLRLLKTFHPGAYDYQCGYPINTGGMPPFEGLRPVDILTGACTLYRKEILDKEKLRFDIFFRDYGMLEDNHLALQLKKRGYENYQCGDAMCEEKNSPSGRSNSYVIGQKTCLNYYYVFQSVCGPLSLPMKWRFFRFQFFEILRHAFVIVKSPKLHTLKYFLGKCSGIFIALFSWSIYVHKVRSST